MSIEIPPGRKLSEMTQVELCALVDAHTEKNGPPVESYDEKNTYFGWTDDGKGVWCLPGSKANLDRLEDLWRMHPGLGQCEIMRLAGAEFFADWRDSDRARAVKEDGARFAEEQGSKVMEENDGACDHPGTQ
jgi:hypothetical protein